MDENAIVEEKKEKVSAHWVYMLLPSDFSNWKI